ncbi:MAG: SCO1664 family protein [Acidimicrobiales bacterium]
MPEDERPPAAPHLSVGERLEVLARGEVEVEGRMPWSSNATFLARVELGGGFLRAIYKPGAGERPLWDFPGGLYRREVAAFELARATGLEVVPETVLRADAPLGEGSLQRFVEADFTEHYFTLLKEPGHLPGLRRVAGFDLLANNADRKGGHLLVDAAAAIWGIDHGLCFHEAPKLRTVMWDFAGDPLPEEVLAACEVVKDELPAALYALLSPEECVAISCRAEDLLAEPHYPAPRDDYRSYPWPLV